MAKIGSLKIVDSGRMRAGRDEAPPEALGRAVAQAAYDVHKALGPGLSDPAIYVRCLAETLRQDGHAVAERPSFPVKFQSLIIEDAFIPDLVVMDSLVVLVRLGGDKTVFSAELTSALKVTGKSAALLIDFREPDVRKGVMRATVQNGQMSPPPAKTDRSMN